MDIAFAVKVHERSAAGEKEIGTIKLNTSNFIREYLTEGDKPFWNQSQAINAGMNMAYTVFIARGKNDLHTTVEQCLSMLNRLG